LALDKKYRDRFITLITFAKEFGCPAIRIGLAIGPSALLTQAKIYQRHKIEIMPAPSIEIGKILLRHIDVQRSGKVFAERMKRTVSALNALGWDSKIPDMGINLFVDAPSAFHRATTVSSGTLFSYHILQTCQVMARPGIVYGNKLAHTVRFVLSPYLKEIDEVFARFKQAGIHYNMELPPDLEKTFLEDAAKGFAEPALPKVK
jgi:aspartate/methionine/tyrosine aminotransferase